MSHNVLFPAIHMHQNRIPGRIALLLIALGSMLPAPPEAEAAERKKQHQSAFASGDGAMVSSSALIKLINNELDGKYENLSIVMKSCGSGEFATRAAATTGGLKGTWSVATASSAFSSCYNLESDKPKKNNIPGLKIGTYYYQGYPAQYIRRIFQNNQIPNYRGAKDRHDRAKEKSYVQTGSKYESSGATANDFDINGGEKGNRAIIMSQPAGFGVTLTDRLYTELDNAGYSDATIDLLRGTTTGGTVDRKSTIADLESALTAMRTVLDADTGKVNAFMFFDGHGGYRSRTIAYRDGQLDQLNGGVWIADAAAGKPGSTLSLDIFTEDAWLIEMLKEELPNLPGTGLWADDPNIYRAGTAYVAFSTDEESFNTASKSVSISAGGNTLGSIDLDGSATGGDYEIALSDSVLDALMPSIVADKKITLTFSLPTTADAVRLAVEQDYDEPAYPNLDYGIGIGTRLGSEVDATQCIIVVGAASVEGGAVVASCSEIPSTPPWAGLALFALLTAIGAALLSRRVDA